MLDGGSLAAQSGLPRIALVAVGENELVLEGGVLFAEMLDFFAQGLHALAQRHVACACGA